MTAYEEEIKTEEESQQKWYRERPATDRARQEHLNKERLERERVLKEEKKEQLNKAELQNKPSQALDEPMGLTFFVFFLIFCILADLIDVFTLGTVGWVTGFFVDAILLLATGLSRSSRRQFKRIVVGVLGDSIPLINVLPFRSIFLTWAFIKSQSSKISTIASSVSSELL